MTAHLLERLGRLLESQERAVVSGPRGAAVSLLVAALARRFQHTTLLVVPDQETANATLEDLKFFADSGEARPVVLSYPAPDVEPYDALQPHPVLGARRLGALHHLRVATPGVIVVAPAEALLRRVMPPDTFRSATYRLEVDQTIDRDRLVGHMVAAGYFSTELVEDVGCFSVRGGVLDLFSPAHQRPVRVEFFGDTIESLRLFDIETQRSSESVDHYTVVPTREQILEPTFVQRATRAIKRACDQVHCPSFVRKQIIDDLESGISFPGIEYLDHLLYPALVTLADYLGNVTVIVAYPQAVQHALNAYRDKVEQRFETVQQDERYWPPPEALFSPADETYRNLESHAQLSISDHFDTTVERKNAVAIAYRATTPLRERLASASGEDHPLRPLVERLENWVNDGYSVLLSVQSTIQARRLAGLLEPYGLPLKGTSERPTLEAWLTSAESGRSGIHLALGRLSHGLVLPDFKVAVVTEQDIFGERARGTTERGRLKRAISDFSQLERGDLVVHAVHGVGIFRGLTKLEVDQTANDFVLIEYRDGDKLYLPVHKLAVLQRYAGTGGRPTLDKLGGATFARKKRKARRAALKLAQELLAMEAARAASPGLAFKRYDRNSTLSPPRFPTKKRRTRRQRSRRSSTTSALPGRWTTSCAAMLGTGRPRSPFGQPISLS